MIKPAALVAALLISALPLSAQKKPQATAKKAPAPTIRFQGATQYSQEEMLAASGFKPGAHLTPSAVRTAAKQLNDTGLFSVVKFSNDSKGLLFSLTPSSHL